MCGKKGIVFDIQKYCIHDGPGIRTVIFMKGCPLRCLWCANPESQEQEPQFAFFKDKCIGDKICVESCGSAALSFSKQGLIRDWEKCILCENCARVCYAKAIQLYGKVMYVDQIVEECLRDEAFYKKSGGGITLSGGEPLFQPEFALALLKAFHQYHIHTAIETTGFYSRERLKQAVLDTDLFLYDLKGIDDGKHRKFTGVSNRKILENLCFLSETGKEIIIRIPLIPEHNSFPEDIHQLIAFLKGLPRKHEIHLLPYHRLGVFKYDVLGKNYTISDLKPPQTEEMEVIKKEFEKNDLQVKIGG